MSKKIIFLCGSDPRDRKVWSGSIYKMYEALLREGYAIEWLPITYLPWELKAVEIISRLFYKIFNRKYNVHQDFLLSFRSGRRLSRRLKKIEADAVFAPACVNELAFLKSDLPIVYFNDANARQLINYNYALFNIGFLSKRITESIERRALNNVAVAAFSSDWAADFARDFYGIPSEKIAVAKLGSNSDVPAELIYDKNLKGEIKFIFLAAAWERKGGDIALSTIKELHMRGHKVSLTVVGCIPPDKHLPEYVTVYPFLNRNIPDEKRKIEELLGSHHIMFVPTRSDAYGLIYVEGAAYGMPSVAPYTGGVPSIINDGETGLLLPFASRPEDYADRIEEVYLNHPAIIKEHGMAARKKYEEELNWGRWGQQMRKRINGLLK